MVIIFVCSLFWYRGHPCTWRSILSKISWYSRNGLWLHSFRFSLQHSRVIQEQVKLRDNALQQAAQLLEYKRLLAQSNTNFIGILVSLLAAPLAQARRRTEEEHLQIEIVLHLIRNLLQARSVLRDTNDTDAHESTHHALVQVLHEQYVLDVLCVLCADLDQPHSPNAAYNLLLMEILQHLVLPSPVPHVVAAAVETRDAAVSQQQQQQPQSDGNSGGTATTTTTTAIRTTAKPKSAMPIKRAVVGGAGTLRQSMRRERQSVQAKVAARHGNFGGSLVLGGGGQENNNNSQKQPTSSTSWTVSTTQFAQSTLGRTTVSAGHGTSNISSKRAPVFVGANHMAASSRRNRLEASPTPAGRRACTVLAAFGQRFLQDCFAPWAKSLKNEFRRDSVRLEDGDRVVWLQLVAYWSQLWRSLQAHKVLSTQRVSKQASSIGPLVFCMDVFSFHLVHNATDTFMQHKEWGKLAHAVALLKEMMLLLQVLYNNKTDETEQIMAMGLLDRLFYGSEPLDRLPKLLSQWQPGQGSHAYAADLAELVHTQIKLLEQHAKVCDAVVSDADKNRKRKKHSKDTTSQHADTITKMKLAAADFDVGHYVRKLATAHNVYLYTQLLAQYAVNGTRLNHRIITFLLRISQIEVADATTTSNTDNYRHEEGAAESGNSLVKDTSRRASLEPMLYNIRLLWVLHTILNDAAAREDASLNMVVQFATRLVTRFAQLAAVNPMLIVEALVKHPAPHRYCQAVTHHYVSEELVMLADRDLLLQEKERWEEEQELDEFNEGDNDDDEGMEDNDEKNVDMDDVAKNRDGIDKEEAKANVSRRSRFIPKSVQNDNDSDSEEEVEFDDRDVQAVPTSTIKAATFSKKRKAILDDSDDEDDNDANDENNSHATGPFLESASSEPSQPSPSKIARTTKNELRALEDKEEEGTEVMPQENIVEELNNPEATFLEGDSNDEIDKATKSQEECVTSEDFDDDANDWSGEETFESKTHFGY